MTGASEGIGKEFAKELAKSGFNVAVASRSESKLKVLESEIKAYNPSSEVRVVPVDLSSNNMEPLLEQQEVWDNLGILVNNAGQLVADQFLTRDPDSIQSMMKLNHNAMAVLTKHAYLSFKKQKQEAKHRFGLVQLSSTGSEFPLPQLAVYTATKRFNQIFG